MENNLKIHNKKIVWLIAYIDANHLNRVEADLKKLPQFKGVIPYIPTVKVLRKTFKGKQHFEEVPLLFNYGFFGVPRKYAVHKNYLDLLQENVNAIFSWVRDPLKKINTKVAGLKESKIKDHHISIATTTSSKIAEFINDSFKFSAHDSTEIDALTPGQIIILHGYPFEGIEAEIVSLNIPKKKAYVKILIFDQKKEIEVSFDNLIYTIYHNKNYDDSLSAVQSLDQMNETQGNQVNRQIYKNFRNAED